MLANQDLNNLRFKIDAVDDEIIRLFQERMHISSEIAEFKKAVSYTHLRAHET